MPNYSYSYTTYYTPFYMVVLPILAAIVAIAGGLALYFLFTRKPNRFTGAAARLHDILNFRTFFPNICYVHCIASPSWRLRYTALSCCLHNFSPRCCCLCSAT